MYEKNQIINIHVLRQSLFQLFAFVIYTDLCTMKHEAIIFTFYVSTSEYLRVHGYTNFTIIIRQYEQMRWQHFMFKRVVMKCQITTTWNGLKYLVSDFYSIISVKCELYLHTCTCIL